SPTAAPAPAARRPPEGAPETRRGGQSGGRSSTTRPPPYGDGTSKSPAHEHGRGSGCRQRRLLWPLSGSQEALLGMYFQKFAWICLSWVLGKWETEGLSRYP